MQDSVRHFFKNRSVQVIWVVLALCFLLVAMIWVRAFYGSILAYQEGESYFKKQQYVEAITFFDRSLHWYTPLNPYVRQSAQRLWEIGLCAEQEGDIRLALIAIRTIRQGFCAARSFYTPGKDWIDKCDTKIDSLMAKELEGDKIGGEATGPSAEQGNTEPDIFWSLVLEVGFLGWIGSVIGFLIHALTGRKALKLRSKPAILWGTMVVFFYTLWIMGMMRA
jgi:hypothetical protein